MPIAIKQNTVRFKGTNGQYRGVDVIAENTTSDQVALIQAAGADTIASIPQDYSDLSNTVQDHISALTVTEPIEIVWAQGSISSTTGNSTTTNQNKRLRHNRFILVQSRQFTVSIPDGFRLYVFYFSEPRTAAFVEADGWKSGTFTETDAPGEYVKFVLSLTNDAELTPESVTTPVLLYKKNATDATLSLSGKAADAKATGDAIDHIKNTFSVETTPEIEWAEGSIDTGNGKNITATNRIRIRYYQPVGLATTVTIPEGMCANSFYYSAYGSAATGQYFIRSDGPFTGTFTITDAPYFRVTLYYEDLRDLDISASEGVVITRSNVADASLTQEHKAADAKATGDRIAQISDGIDDRFNQIMEESDAIAEVTGDASVLGIQFTKISDHEFQLSGTPTKTSSFKIFNTLFGANETITNVSITPVKNITEPGIYTLAYELSDSSRENENYFAVTYGMVKERRYLKSGDSFEISANSSASLFIYVGTKTTFAGGALNIKWGLYEGAGREGTGYYEVTAVDTVARERNAYLSEKLENAQYTEPISWGQANMLARANHIKNIKWTPLGNIPKGSAYFDLVEQTGIPYSSVRDDDKAVGMDVSIRTFMTAVHDPNSVLYTRRSTTDNASTYYGTVCSGLINYSTGIELDLTNYFLGEWDGFETVPMQDIQVGDMLYVSGHVAMITGVKKDRYGRISNVEVTEEFAPLPRTLSYTWASFIDARSEYIARRYKYRSTVPYTEVPYIQNFDEDLVIPVYPDVQTEFGDAAVFMVGADVKINVIDASDYTSITVTRGSTTVHTTSTIASFTLTNVQPGLHTITASGTTDSVSTFFVVDATGSFDALTGIVTFSSTNATPALVNVYNWPMTGSERLRNKPILLTDEDRARGSIDVSSYMDEAFKNAKVTFKTEYGTAVWYSETHSKWEPIT